MSPTVLDISPHGFWLLIDDEEYFLTFEDFPWFREAKVSEISDVKLLNRKHLFWEKLVLI
jgi:hypothetical protein